jgi:iron complex transport system substrate-binding protein
MRIASLISAGTEMLFAMGVGDQIVAVSHECDWPLECLHLPRATRSNVNSTAESGEIDQQVHALLEVGKPLYEIDASLLSELQPDLIVTQAQCDVCAVRYSDVLDVVQNNSRLRTTQVFSLNPQSLQDVLNDILRLGNQTKVIPQATQVFADLQQRIQQVRCATSAIASEKRPRVAMIEWTDPLMLAGNWVPELVELAGGHCELIPLGEHSRYCTWDELLQFDPQVIIVCPCGFGLQRAQAEVQSLVQRPGWNSISASKTGRVYALDGNAYFNRPGPRLVDSLELLAKLLHGTHSFPR